MKFGVASYMLVDVGICFYYERLAITSSVKGQSRQSAGPYFPGKGRNNG